MSQNDQRIKQGLEKKKAELGALEIRLKEKKDIKLKTNLLFPSANGTINLRAQGTLGLMDAFSKVNLFYRDAKDLQSLIDKDFETQVNIGNDSIEDWRHDIAVLYQIVVLNEKIKEIKLVIAKASNLISNDLKTAMELDELGL